jgi:hypothetical protein
MALASNGNALRVSGTPMQSGCKALGVNGKLLPHKAKLLPFDGKPMGVKAKALGLKAKLLPFDGKALQRVGKPMGVKGKVLPPSAKPLPFGFGDYRIELATGQRTGESS